MDTGTRDASHVTPEAQAQLVHELGYAGIGWSLGDLSSVLPAFDKQGVKAVTLYAGLKLGDETPAYPPELPKAIEALKGRGTLIWLYVTHKKLNPSDRAGDDEAVGAIRDVADLAAKSGLRVALYPHTGFWMERVQDCTRLANLVDRPNVGSTFNLCHCLRVGDEAKIPALLREAMPRLFAVSINGADHKGDWDRLIQTLDRGTFDVAGLLRTLKELGYAGPIGLQAYGIKGDARDNLRRSMDAWRKLSGQTSVK